MKQLFGVYVFGEIDVMSGCLRISVRVEDAVVVGRDGLCHHHDCRLSIGKLRD